MIDFIKSVLILLPLIFLRMVEWVINFVYCIFFAYALIPPHLHGLDPNGLPAILTMIFLLVVGLIPSMFLLMGVTEYIFQNFCYFYVKSFEKLGLINKPLVEILHNIDSLKTRVTISDILDYLFFWRNHV